MTRPKSLQVHVTVELAERVRAAAKRRDISVSEWIRSLLSQACENGKRGLTATLPGLHSPG